MCHRNIQQIRRHPIPSVDRYIIEICPVKEESRIENTVFTGICEIDRLLWFHGDKHLNKRKDPPENTFMGVLDDLIICVTNRDIAALQLNVDNRHAIYE